MRKRDYTKTTCAAVLEGPVAKGTRSAVTWRRQCANPPRKGKRYCGVHKRYED